MNYKIYKITDNTNGNVYIGQTKSKYLCERMGTHRYAFKNMGNCSSKLILCNNDWRYDLIEDNLNKQQANIKEEYYIQNTPNCINKIKYTRYTNKEQYQNNLKNHQNFNKKKYEKHKEKYKLYSIKNYEYKKLWGGDPRNSNNLLKISPDLFN